MSRHCLQEEARFFAIGLATFYEENFQGFTEGGLEPLLCDCFRRIPTGIEGPCLALLGMIDDGVATTNEEDPDESLRSSQTLIPRLYDELRRLAAYKISNEGPNQTLSGTALLHEAYLRLDKEGTEPKWANERQFYYAAAEAMRRILIDRIRAKKRIKRGGEFERIEYEEDGLSSGRSDEKLLAINESLERLEKNDPASSNLVKLRFFVGLSLEEISQSTGISVRTLSRQWAFAKAWLARDLDETF